MHRQRRDFTTRPVTLVQHCDTYEDLLQDTGRETLLLGVASTPRGGEKAGKTEW